MIADLLDYFKTQAVCSLASMRSLARPPTAINIPPSTMGDRPAAALNLGMLVAASRYFVWQRGSAQSYTAFSRDTAFEAAGCAQPAGRSASCDVMLGWEIGDLVAAGGRG
jgi:hypothetical protein